MDSSEDPFAPRGVHWRAVSDALVRARLIVAAAVFAVPTLALALLAAAFGQGWLWTLLAVVVVLAVVTAVLIPRQVRAMGYAEREDDLLVRRGVLVRTLVVVPYGRLQYVDVQAGPVARALGIASLELNTASVATGASIKGLPAAEASRLRDQLASRGEARLAGL